MNTRALYGKVKEENASCLCTLCIDIIERRKTYTKYTKMDNPIKK